jgi:hypothetical protein
MMSSHLWWRQPLHDINLLPSTISSLLISKANQARAAMSLGMAIEPNLSGVDYQLKWKVKYKQIQNSN